MLRDVLQTRNGLFWTQNTFSMLLPIETRLDGTVFWLSKLETSKRCPFCCKTSLNLPYLLRKTLLIYYSDHNTPSKCFFLENVLNTQRL